MGLYEEAEQLFSDAFAYIDDVRDEDPKLAAKILLEMAGIYREQTLTKDARNYGRQALAAAEDSGDGFLTAQSQNMLGLIEQGQGGYAQATELFEAAANTLRNDESESEKAARLLSRIQNNLGLSALLLGNYA